QRRDALHVGDLPARDRLHRRLRPRPAAAGGLTTATPIIASRGTSAASSASPQRPVPARPARGPREPGPAPQAHVRVPPVLRSTTRGSRTARERYSNDLYQTGGRPISACG